MYKKLIYKYIAVCKLNCNHNKIFGATTELVEAIYQNYFKTMLEYIYAYTYTHIHIHTYIHIHLHTYIHIFYHFMDPKANFPTTYHSIDITGQCKVQYF